MKTRIRYTKQEDGKLKSTTVIVGTKSYYVQINTDNSFDVLDFDTLKHYSGLSSRKTLNEAKKEAKNMLKTMGAVFGDEIRNRKAKLVATLANHNL